MKKPRLKKITGSLMVDGFLSKEERKDVSDWLYDLSEKFRRNEISEEGLTAQLRYY